MKNIISVILAVTIICSVTLFSSYSTESAELTYGKFTYTIDNNEITITGFNSSNTEAEIPAEIEGIPVTTIGENAFAGKARLITLVLPDTITRIESKAFLECGVKELNFSDSLTYIGDQAFKNGGVEHVTFGKNIQHIGKEAFANCDDTDFTDIVLPDSVTEIGEGIFSGCSYLRNASFGKGLTYIPDYCFYNCPRLLTFDAISPITQLGISSFENCSNFSFIEGFELDYGLEIIPDRAFAYSGIRGITIPDTVTVIGDSAFEGAQIYIDVSLPNSVTTIGDNAFLRCTLKNISIPNSVKTIGKNAFAVCEYLESIIIPASVETLGEYALSSCSRLIKATIEWDSPVTEMIGVVDYCESLTYFIVPEGVTDIGSTAFKNCSKLQNVYLPSTLTSIYNTTFQNCNELANIYFGGTEEQWKAIFIDNSHIKGNIEKATIHFNANTENVAPKEYKLTINEHNYMIQAGQEVTVTAPKGIVAGPVCYGFDFWVCETLENDLHLDSSNLEQTFIMPETDVELRTILYLVGDLNFSETIEGTDVMGVLYSIKNGGDWNKYSDINIDGSINAMDVMDLMRIIKGEYDYAPYLTE